MLDNHVNREALRQLGVFHEDNDRNDYHRNRLHSSRYDVGDNQAAVVSEVARRIAKAAFNSEESDSGFSIRVREAGSGFWDLLKRTVEKPGVKEGLIVAAVMASKVSLWFAYRKAQSQNLDIIDL